MKVAVITRHAITNYGSLLQAYATQKVIEDMGHDCEIIDYVRYDENYKRIEKTLLKKKDSWNGNPIKRAIYLGLRQPESLFSGKKMEKERVRFLKLTRRFSSIQELNEDKPIADIYLTGSDQVWGPVSFGIYDEAYCLSFTKDNDKRVSYASSFGHTVFSNDLKSYYSGWLKRYNAISVREESALEIIKDLGLQAQKVLDPTLLLSGDYWSKLTSEGIKQKYILIYQLHNDSRLGNYAKRVSKKMGLKLIRISTSLHQISREGSFCWCPNISEFLTYIKNAELMITDSFHGTAFALTFNTPFIEILPNDNTETRNISILKLTGLTNRVLKDFEDLSLAEEKIDFTYANETIIEERNRSIDYLKNVLTF